MPDWDALRRWISAEAGLELAGQQVERLAAFVDLLLFWNRRLALVSQRDSAAVLDKHVADSLFTAAHCAGAARLVDLGSGAGFPGIPVAIALPSTAVCLIESRGKKARFLEEAKRTLRASNVEVLNDRIERVASQPEHAARYDAATVRALTDLGSCRDLAQPFLTPTGHLVAMRSASEALPSEFASARVIAYTLPDGTPRRLVIVSGGRPSR
jgi:16S rRNA (guanine527-N7)-methyltransferase